MIGFIRALRDAYKTKGSLGSDPTENIRRLDAAQKRVDKGFTRVVIEVIAVIVAAQVASIIASIL